MHTYTMCVRMHGVCACCVYKKECVHVMSYVLYVRCVCKSMQQCSLLTTGGMLTFVGRFRRVKKTENRSHHIVNV